MGLKLVSNKDTLCIDLADLKTLEDTLKTHAVVLSQEDIRTNKHISNLKIDIDIFLESDIDNVFFTDYLHLRMECCKYDLQNDYLRLREHLINIGCCTW